MGKSCKVTSKNHIMNPVAIITAEPQTTAKYSNFSKGSNLPNGGGWSAFPTWYLR